MVLQCIRFIWPFIQLSWWRYTFAYFQDDRWANCKCDRSATKSWEYHIIYSKMECCKIRVECLFMGAGNHVTSKMYKFERSPRCIKWCQHTVKSCRSWLKGCQKSTGWWATSKCWIVCFCLFFLHFVSSFWFVFCCCFFPYTTWSPGYLFQHSMTNTPIPSTHFITFSYFPTPQLLLHFFFGFTF